jgi:lysyl-tRNA synthetase class 2
MTVPFIEQNDQTEARHAHLEALRALVGNVYPNKFERTNVTETPAGEDTITSIVEKFKKYEPQVNEGEKPSADALESANNELNRIRVRIAGRIAAPPRVMGKAAFLHLSDGAARLQIYVRRQDVVGVRNDVSSTTDSSLSNTVDGWQLFSLLDHGDYIGVEGYLFVTKTGELSVHAEKLQFLAKALLPMPDKMHGINDPEIRQRQRYADLIAGSLKLERDPSDLTPREVFELRSKVIREIRRFLDEHGYIEVETPMLTPLATGAAARAFETHHNALDIKLYARIAPELYLKRLTVGGFEKVYELNRNFRNEGISTKHNPEFTMLEYYWAYADVNKMMDMHEEMMRSVVYTALGHTHVRYGEHEIDFSQPFQRMTMKEAIARYWPDDLKSIRVKGQVFNPLFLDDRLKATALSTVARNYAYFNRNRGRADVEVTKTDEGTNRRIVIPSEDSVAEPGSDYRRDSAYIAPLPHALLIQTLEMNADATYDEFVSWVFEDKDGAKASHAHAIVAIFEAIAEPHLIQPTFITDFPKPVSPLSKASPSDPSVAERFEYFVGALESANGFSELNDPEEQYQRFQDQVQQRERGDEEAMVMDEDYIRALSYGMPPAAGIGVGIDRLVMLLANKHSIRDVILFPHMRPERSEGSRQEAGGSKPETGQ